MINLEHVTSINGSTVAVYAQSEFCYYYEILFWDGYLYQSPDSYLYSAIALKVGVNEVRTVMGY